MSLAAPFLENGYTLAQFRATSIAKVPHQRIDIDLADKPAWYGEINPKLTVPSLRLPNGTVLTESLDITAYIASEFPEAKLLPDDPAEHTKTTEFVDLFSQNINTTAFKLLMAKTTEEQKQASDTLLDGIKKVNDALAKQWTSTSGKGGPFWLGDRFSIVEVNTASFVNNLLVIPKHYRGFVLPQTDEYAAFNRWVGAIYAHPEFTRVQPADETIIKAAAKFVAPTATD
ncbi:glutathione S-transferase [Linderina pennispora]|uniref:Glutathione S-transferase n=1 Tax=Linderina pennispora TaxID=61395 RepID=A0A1Y1WIA8_9FUNG|nr:glutathione S-transferase [Linderina pennispora]ORX73311.1 glutathione S-transferase [Linderina pennispora]